MFVAARAGAPPLRTRKAMPLRCSGGISVVVGAAGSADVGAAVGAGEEAVVRTGAVVRGVEATGGTVELEVRRARGRRRVEHERRGVRRDDLRGVVVGEGDADEHGHADERDAADDLTDAHPRRV